MLGYVSRVRDVESQVDENAVTSEQIEANAVRCPDTDAAEQMYKGMHKMVILRLACTCVHVKSNSISAAH